MSTLHWCFVCLSENVNGYRIADEYEHDRSHKMCGGHFFVRAEPVLENQVVPKTRHGSSDYKPIRTSLISAESWQTQLSRQISFVWVKFFFHFQNWSWKYGVRFSAQPFSTVKTFLHACYIKIKLIFCWLQWCMTRLSSASLGKAVRENMGNPVAPTRATMAASNVCLSIPVAVLEIWIRVTLDYQ